MTLKTYLLHLNDAGRAGRLIAAARGFAGEASVHYVGLHVAPGLPAAAPAIVSYGEDVLDSVKAAERSDAGKIEQAFRTAMQGQSCEFHAIASDAGHPDLAREVMRYGRWADLVVAPQADPDWGLAPVLDFPERLAIETGRPVLLVPNAGPARTLMSRAVVAWDGGREAARAAFDAMALLAPQTAVVLLNLAEGAQSDERGVQALCETWRRHGFSCGARTAALAGRNVGAALIAEAEELGADLLVMGAYGHSRLREFVFGGATRAVTHAASLPVLLSH